MKGQVSTELLVVVALVLLIFIPLLVMVYMKANEADQQIGSYQAELAVSRIVSIANSVGSLGTNTSVTTDVYIPPNTVSFDTRQAGAGSEIVLTLRTAQGNTETSDIVRYPMKSPGPIAQNLMPGGYMKIRISSTTSPGGNAVITIEPAQQ
jgi:hypothetical protein